MSEPHYSAVPADDPARTLTRRRSQSSLADPEKLPHIGLVGDTYTINRKRRRHRRPLLRYRHAHPARRRPAPAPPRLRGDLHPPRRRDRSHLPRQQSPPCAKAKPSTSPPTPRTSSTTFPQQPVRLLCICSPAGQEEFFAEVGVSVASRTTAPPKLDEEQEADFIKKVVALAPKYRTELLREA
jgi:hypothetical protein